MEANTGQDEITEKTLLRLKCSCICQQKSEVMGFHNQTVNQIVIHKKKKKRKKGKTRTVVSLTHHLPVASISISSDRLDSHHYWEYLNIGCVHRSSCHRLENSSSEAGHSLRCLCSLWAGSLRDGTQQMFTAPPNSTTKKNENNNKVCGLSKTFKI